MPLHSNFDTGLVTPFDFGRSCAIRMSFPWCWKFKLNFGNHDTNGVDWIGYCFLFYTKVSDCVEKNNQSNSYFFKHRLSIVEAVPAKHHCQNSAVVRLNTLTLHPRTALSIQGVTCPIDCHLATHMTWMTLTVWVWTNLKQSCSKGLPTIRGRAL